jgi:hypothetical protein
LTCDEFEESWQRLLEMHNLQQNEWLQWLYDERYHWLPTYVKNTFWAGTSTTQRSESTNAFFDGYVGLKTTLEQFVDQYDNALRSKAKKENAEDHGSFKSMNPCITRYAMEKQFQKLTPIKTLKRFKMNLGIKCIVILPFLNKKVQFLHIKLMMR